MLTTSPKSPDSSINTLNSFTAFLQKNDGEYPPRLRWPQSRSSSRKTCICSKYESSISLHIHYIPSYAYLSILFNNFALTARGFSCCTHGSKKFPCGTESRIMKKRSDNEKKPTRVGFFFEDRLHAFTIPGGRFASHLLFLRRSRSTPVSALTSSPPRSARGSASRATPARSRPPSTARSWSSADRPTRRS